MPAVSSGHARLSSVHAFQIVGKFETPESRDFFSVLHCSLRSQLPLYWLLAVNTGGIRPIGIVEHIARPPAGCSKTVGPGGLRAAQHPLAVFWLGDAGSDRAILRSLAPAGAAQVPL